MPDQPNEIDVLRQTNAELVQKNATRKAKIEELQTTVSNLQAQLGEAQTQVRDLTIGVPMRQMAASLSTMPGYFIEQFEKHFRLEMVEGKLTLQTAEGKPVIDKKTGKAVPFERAALGNFLIEGEDERAKLFSAICKVNLASGAGGSLNQPVAPTVKKPQQPQPGRFGLR